MKYAVIAASWLLLSSGCINLEAPPDPTRYFLMNGPDWSESEGGFAVEVEAVTMEPYLASPRMVVRLSGTEVRFSDIHRWAEPLDENIQSVLSGYLAVSSIGTVSNRALHEKRLVVRVHVSQFEGQLPDGATLGASWSIEDATGNTLVRRRSEYTVSGWDGADYEQLTRLLESTLASLAGEIAASI
ncbi:MAG: PqiC family protein [Rhodothermales bacterium]